MPTTLNPYLGFRDDAREAMEFYRSVFGGELTVTTFRDANMVPSPDDADKVMHAQLTTPNGLVLMGSDTPAGMERTPGDTISISLSGDDSGELTGYFNALAAEGAVGVPLEKAPWGDSFGMCTDPFGVHWMVNIAGGGA